MLINIPKAILLGIVLQPVAMAQTACIKGGGYEFMFNKACTRDNFLEAFKDIYTDPLLKPAGCTNTIEEELAALLGVSTANLEGGIKATCKAAQDAKQLM